VDRRTHVAMNFRLTAPSLGFWVDVRVRGYGER
jgi:hypothetical protein